MKVIQPRPFNPRKTLFVGSVIFILIIVALTRNAPQGPAHIHWTGTTMGTYYDIKIAHSPLTQVEARRLYQEVTSFLKKINQQMSTYIEDSEISRFNRHTSTDPFSVSPEFARVTRSALYWAESTGGAFDPTLDPLINAWGFGRHQAQEAPQKELIETALEQVGYGLILVPNDHHIQKIQPDVQLNLNAIAKGYAVDGISSLLRQAGALNHYVEIGGDLVVSGHNIEGNPWRVGIENPDPDALPGQSLYGIAHLSSGALAGSGDYRQFREDEEGLTVSHILDPRTGRPVSHALASVNVWACTCMDADAVATALMVMGHEDGMRWIEKQTNAEAIFFVRQTEGSFETFISSGFIDRTGFAGIMPEE